MRRAALLALLPALALTACGGGDDPSPTASAPPTTAAPTTSAPTATPGGSATASEGPGCPEQPPADPAATVVTADVIGKQVQPPNQTVAVKLGSKVRVAVTTDVADEVHVHTYDLRQDLPAGCTSAIDFVANIPGTVEVELEKAHVHVVKIKAS